MAIVTLDDKVILVNGTAINMQTSGTINNRPVQTVTPTESQQSISYSSPYTGLEGVIVQAIPYPNGDNMGYGSTALTDLTGTSWYFNSTLTDLFDFDMFDINFASNNSSFTSLEFFDGSDLYYGEAFVYSSYWFNQAYRTISITDGTDATNADLIAWIQANATEVTS